MNDIIYSYLENEKDGLGRDIRYIKEEQLPNLVDRLKQQFSIPVVSSSSKLEPPKPPFCRVLRTGVGRFCKNCNSTMSKSGFLILFGKRYCDNKKCPNSKPERNYN